MCVCVYVCMYVCICSCVYIYIYVHDFLWKVWGTVRNQSLRRYLGLSVLDRPTALPKALEFTGVKAPFCKACPFAPAKQHRLRYNNSQFTAPPPKKETEKHGEWNIAVCSSIWPERFVEQLNFQTKPEPKKQKTGTWVPHEQIALHKLYQCCLLLKTPEGKMHIGMH